MKFLNFIYDEKEQIGFLNLDEKKVLGISEALGHERYTDMNRFIEQVTEAELETISHVRSNEKSQGLSVEDVKILSPIVRPKHDIICVGVNYASHRQETTGTLSANLETQELPVYFSKRTTRIIGHGEAIHGFFNLDEQLDYEVELAVIIGKEGANIKKEDVEQYIFGYSIFNDVSSRKLQKGHLQWYKGKSLDTYSGPGPVIVHRSAFAYPPEVEIECRVNGEMRQHSNTNLLIHNLATIISDFSQGITLEPGDIIATGTPSGVGMGSTPPRFLKKGDVVECKIEGIGVLRNHVK